jgi:hypothetical protein
MIRRLLGQDGQFFGEFINPSGLLYPTRQITGTYKVDITNMGNGNITIETSNSMSLSSALYHLPFLPSPDAAKCSGHECCLVRADATGLPTLK